MIYAFQVSEEVKSKKVSCLTELLRLTHTLNES